MWNFCCEKKQKRREKLGSCVLCMGSVIDKSELDDKRKAKPVGASETPDSCVLCVQHAKT